MFCRRPQCKSRVGLWSNRDEKRLRRLPMSTRFAKMKKPTLTKIMEGRFVMPKELIAEMERKMKASLQDLEKDLGTLRTGRATPALLDKITVEYYGSQTPLSQVGTVSSPDPRQLLVQPWDKTVGAAIVAAITKS